MGLIVALAYGTGALKNAQSKAELLSHSVALGISPLVSFIHTLPLPLPIFIGL